VLTEEPCIEASLRGPTLQRCVIVGPSVLPAEYEVIVLLRSTVGSNVYLRSGMPAASSVLSQLPAGDSSWWEALANGFTSGFGPGSCTAVLRGIEEAARKAETGFTVADQLDEKVSELGAELLSSLSSQLQTELISFGNASRAVCDCVQDRFPAAAELVQTLIQQVPEFCPVSALAGISGDERGRLLLVFLLGLFFWQLLDLLRLAKLLLDHCIQRLETVVEAVPTRVPVRFFAQPSGSPREAANSFSPRGRR
jgi:hypothetical protein